MRDPIKHAEAKHRWYEEHKELTYRRTRNSRTARRHRIQVLKEASPCADCGQFYPYYIMEFDHRSGTDKVDNISRLLQRSNTATVLAEIEKCDLVCANCHAERTFARQYDIEVE